MADDSTPIKQWRCSEKHTYYSQAPIQLAFSASNEKGEANVIGVFRPCPYCLLSWLVQHIPESKEVK